MTGKIKYAAFVLIAVTAFCCCVAAADKKVADKATDKTTDKVADKVAGKVTDKSGSDAWSKSRLGQTMFGKVWSGPVITKEDLRGQVVLLKFWGYRCPPCIASIPHMTKLNNTYAKRGLVVIGAHAQGPAKAKALAITKSRGANYTIISSARVPGANFRTIPHVFVFDHRGKVVYEGYPGKKMDKAIIVALKRRPDPLLGDRKYTVMRSTVAKVKSGRLGEAWKECKEKMDAKGAAGEEAAFLFANLERYAKRLTEQAKKQEEESPVKCVEALTKLKQKFAGTPYAEHAEKKLNEQAKDKNFQLELKAEKQYLLIARAAKKITPCPQEPNKKKQWTRRYGSLMRKIKNRIKRLKKQFPDTLAVEKAEKLLEELTGAD